MAIKEQICEATDTLDTLRRSYYQQQGATYEQMDEAARTLLVLRQQAEKQFKGKTAIKIDAVSVARLIRSSF